LNQQTKDRRRTQRQGCRMCKSALRLVTYNNKLLVGVRRTRVHSWLSFQLAPTHNWLNTTN